MTRPETPPIQPHRLTAIKSFLITKKRMAIIRARWRENQCEQACTLHAEMGGLSAIVTTIGTIALNGALLPPALLQQGPTAQRGLASTNIPQPVAANEKITERSTFSIDAKVVDFNPRHFSISVASQLESSSKHTTAEGAGGRAEGVRTMNLSPIRSAQTDHNSQSPGIETQCTTGGSVTGTSASDVASCSICLCNFQLGDEARKLPCSHVFHKDCIDVWLVKHSALCPICRVHCLGKQ
ncbi:hypothetical protein H4R35_004946 [Dimargaris xerosporica]|nr:hypothetical protein H4R35_004946 [Dimargaris xerosporica]